MSKLADAAFQWMQRHHPEEDVANTTLWHGLCEEFPELTATSESRKTPRATLMRDLRHDKKARFVVGSGRLRIARTKSEA